MNFKRFTLFTFSGLILFGGLFQLKQEKESIYFPRQHSYGVASAKGYMDFIKTIKSNQKTGKVSFDEVEKARKQADLLPKGKSSLAMNWSFKGPDNEGGRTRAFLIDKDNSQHLYAGGASGGVYESIDGGNTWTVYDSEFKVQNVSCITQAIDGSIYVGTGGHFETSGNGGKGFFFIGNGIHKLTGNGGFETIVEPSNRVSSETEWATIGQIVADPSNSNILYAATNAGFRIIDMSGIDPVITDPIGLKVKANDIDISVDGNYTVSYEREGLYTTLDDGKNFFTLKYPSVGRIEVAYAPSDSKIAYALMADTNGCMFGVYQSVDKGISWNEIVGSSTITVFTNGVSCQGGWDNAISVYNNDPGTIVIGGVNLYRWQQTSTDPTNPAGSWSQLDVLVKFTANGDRLSSYIHADKHRITFDPNNQNIAYICSDGGISKSLNFTSNNPIYGEINFNYAVTQFYNLAVNSNDVVIAGSQDLGNHLVGVDINNNLGSIKLDFGAASSPGDDGIESAMSTVNPSIGFASSQNGRIRRIQGIGTTSGNSNISVADITSNNDWLGALCSSTTGCSDVFYTTLKLWESFDHKASKDSVDFQLFTKELPPHQYFSEESNNSSSERVIMVYDTLGPPRNPNDTLIVGSVQIDSTKNIKDLKKEGNLSILIINYDTLKIDIANSIVSIHHANGNVENKPFTIGQSVPYDNQFLSAQPDFGTIFFQIDTVTIDNTLEYTITYISTQITFYYEGMIQDIVQTMLATANWPGRGNNFDERNIYITRDAMKNSPVINWYSVAGTNSTPDPIEENDDVLTTEFSHDGKYLFFGTKSGKVYRLKGLDLVQDYMKDSTYQYNDTTRRDTVLRSIKPTQSGSWYFIQDSTMAGNCQIIADYNGQAITDISSDPNNSNNLVVSLGNYGNDLNISRTDSATVENINNIVFSSLQGFDSGALPSVPAYSVLIDYKDANTVYVGNELGVFATTNAFESVTRNETIFQRGDTTIRTRDTVGMIDTSKHEAMAISLIIKPLDSLIIDTVKYYFPADTQYVVDLRVPDTISFVADTQFVRSRPIVNWTEENIGMGRIPVFGLEQMVLPWPYATNTGKIYAATHGRGIFEQANFVGVPNVKHNVYKDGFKSSLKFYPNPAKNDATVEFNIEKSSKVQIEVYDIRGKLVTELTTLNLTKGNNKIKLDLSQFVNGTYIVRAINEKEIATSKFVLYR